MDRLRLILEPERTDEFFTVSVVKHRLLLRLVYSVVAESHSGRDLTAHQAHSPCIHHYVVIHMKT